MKDHYDFSQSVKNPYFKDLQESVTLQATMTLNQKQLDILKAIEKLELIQRSGLFDDHIAQELNFDNSLVGHYLDNLKNQGYINFIQDGVSSSRLIRGGIKLTDKGKVAVNHPDDLISEEKSNVNNINNFNAPINAPIGVLQNSNDNTVNITQNNNQNIQEIINSLEFLEKEIQVFPKEEKEEALVCLSDLKEEIKGSQNPIKIRILLRSFLAIALPLIGLIVNGADFANNMTDLTTKYNVPMPQISLPFQ
jgi:DNA-binding MarR family transcriptional regulator